MSCLNFWVYLISQFEKNPCFGSRKLKVALEQEGYIVNRKLIQRIMRLKNLVLLYQKPRLSCPNIADKKYPYILKNIKIDKPNQVWASDITYVKCDKGRLYLTAIIDWYSRYILSWRVSNTMDTEFCIDALEDALSTNKPQIFNTNQGSQFTSKEFTSMLLKQGIQISMDGKGRYRDNILIERFWRTIKYENLLINSYNDINELKKGFYQFINYYNYERPHAALGYRKPAEVYYEYRQNKKENLILMK